MLASSVLARRTRLPRLPSSGTTAPRLSKSSKNPRSNLLPKLDTLVLASRGLLVSKNHLPRSAIPDLVVPETNVANTITMTARAFLQSRAVRRPTLLLNLYVVGMRALFMGQLRIRSLKSFLMPPPLALAASHQIGIF